VPPAAHVAQAAPSRPQAALDMPDSQSPTALQQPRQLLTPQGPVAWDEEQATAAKAATIARDHPTGAG
jgi:hypothetical protein